jgi:Trk K+ transport system NAD-binding subunit
MKAKRSLKDRLRYWLDNLYSSGTSATVITLGILTLMLAVLCTAILVGGGLAPGDEEKYSLLEGFWVSLLSAIGDGSIGGRESSWNYRLLMLAMTFGSIFIGSFFISALTNGMVSRVNEIKKGRSIVIEDGHIVILGWSEQIYTVISELLVANVGQKKACIVILGNKPKESMEEDIRTKVNLNKRTRIVCRTGDPMDMADLNMVSLNSARTIIVLQPESDYPDADVLKTVLAITNHPDRGKKPYHIVAAIRNPRNYEIARVSGKEDAHWLITFDIIARVIAQTSLQPGLSVVYDHLFNFIGDEIYMKAEPRLVGKTFQQATLASSSNALIGICAHNQRIYLNPEPTRIIESGDRLVVIGRDDQAVRFDLAVAPDIRLDLISTARPARQKLKQILILGWNRRGVKVIRELDQYVPPGSEVTVMADDEKAEEVIDRSCQKLDRLSVCFFPGDTDDRQILEGILFKEFDHIIILSYSDRLSHQRADAKTLITLLHLREIKDIDQRHFTVVSEMMDVRNYQLAVTARADDYVVSERIPSQLMAQIAQDAKKKELFDELLNPESSEIYLKPVELYVRCGKAVNFYTVIEAAQRRKEAAFGYRISVNTGDASSNYGVVINPQKAAEITFEHGDKIIVLADSGLVSKSS